MLDEGKSSDPSIRSRRMLPEDAVAVRRILEESPEGSDWSELAIRNSLQDQQTVAFVSECGEEIIGCIFGTRVVDEAEILNFAVKSSDRRKGVGSDLVRHLLTEWERSGTRRIFLEVRESNLDAISFYERLGFHQVGRRKQYYLAPEEDALVLEKSAPKIIHRLVPDSS